MTPPDLSVILVSYRTGPILDECLASLLDAPQNTTFELFVIENAQTPDARERLMALQQRYAGRPGVVIKQSETNLGFAAANNVGLSRATGRNLLLLNPDTQVAPGALGAMVRQLDALPPDAGILGFRLENPDGTPQVAARTLPSWKVALHQNTLAGSFGLFRGEVRRHKLDGFAFDQPREVGQVMGAAFAFPRRTLDRLGPLDPGFFVYFEEVDYCTRARDTGLRVLFSPTPAVRHYGGVSAAQAADAMFAVYLDSLLRYQRKHLPPAAARLFGSVFKILFVPKLLLEIAGLALKIGKNRLRGKPDKVARDQAQLRGRTHFLTGGLWRFLLRA